MEEEGNDVMRGLDELVRTVRVRSESANRDVDKLVNCNEGGVKRMYLQVTKVLGRMEEQVAIIGITLDIDDVTEDAGMYIGHWICRGGGGRKYALGPFGEDNRPLIGEFWPF